MPTDPETVQEAVRTLREAYIEECHLAADAVVARVKSGEVDTDETLWHAIKDTHRARIEGTSVTPRWAPLLFSAYPFSNRANVISSFEQTTLQSDILWEYNRLAWMGDVCHALNEHHQMPVAGLSLDEFVTTNPLDALADREDTIEDIVEDLRQLAMSARNDDTRVALLQQASRLERANPNLNPSPSRRR